MTRNLLLASLGVLVLLTSSQTAWSQKSAKVLFKKKTIVIEESQREPGGEDRRTAPANFLLYDRTAYGVQFQKPARERDLGKPDADFSRLATTYYHRHSPVGIALEKFNWFPGPFNTYAADARWPASLVAGSAQPALFGLASLWSEPPICVAGMQMGTVASYARPTQHWHFFEHNPELIKLCRPAPKDKRLFHFVEDAQDRGALIQIHEGESRPLMEKAPDGFFHLLIVEAIKEDNDQKIREGLLTREGMKLSMDKLAPGGILCYHTSCRYYRLDELIGSTAKSLGYECLVGHDPYDSERRDSAFSSEWVMVARRRDDLKHLKAPADHAEKKKKLRFAGEYWQAIRVKDSLVWSDAKIKYQGLYRADPHLVRVLRNVFYDAMEYLPQSWRHYDSFVYRNVEGALRSLENFRVGQLNRER